jgi:hypothetical protein
MASHSNLESICLNAETLDVLLYIVNHFKLPIVLHSSDDDTRNYTTDEQYSPVISMTDLLEYRLKLPDSEILDQYDYVKETVVPHVTAWAGNNSKISGGDDWSNWLLGQMRELKIPDTLVPDVFFSA